MDGGAPVPSRRAVGPASNKTPTPQAIDVRSLLADMAEEQAMWEARTQRLLGDSASRAETPLPRQDAEPLAEGKPIEGPLETSDGAEGAAKAEPAAAAYEEAEAEGAAGEGRIVAAMRAAGLLPEQDSELPVALEHAVAPGGTSSPEAAVDGRQDAEPLAEASPTEGLLETSAGADGRRSGAIVAEPPANNEEPEAEAAA